VVDDELANVRLLQRRLELWGVENVCSTTNPLETVDLFLSFQPDVILLDLMMPLLDGFEVMQQLHPLIPAGSYLPILVLTADTTLLTRHKALDAGARDFLTKPFDEVELSLRLKNLVQTRRLHQELALQNQTLDEKVHERTLELRQSEIETVECLALAAEFRDDDTGHHTQRVGETAAALAEYLGLPEARVDLIRKAAPLHDVGKIGIPDRILLKPGKLTPEEFDVMKSHALIGSQILSHHHTPLLQLASQIALTHHERWDGNGYPNRLGGDTTPIEGRIVAVADVFDALTHERPYKAAWPREQALAEIANQSGRQFDPQIAEALPKVVDQIGV